MPRAGGKSDAIIGSESELLDVLVNILQAVADDICIDRSILVITCVQIEWLKGSEKIRRRIGTVSWA